MKMRLFTAALFLMVAVVTTSASDPIAVYAKVDKVVFEPDERAPTTVQVWGVFSIAKENHGNDYLPAARGYLYFRAGDNTALSQREWADLKSVAGTAQIVSFGTRFTSVPRLRAASEPPAKPDPYVVNVGLTKVSGQSQLPQVRSILDLTR